MCGHGERKPGVGQRGGLKATPLDSGLNIELHKRIHCGVTLGHIQGLPVYALEPGICCFANEDRYGIRIPTSSERDELTTRFLPQQNSWGGHCQLGCASWRGWFR